MKYLLFFLPTILLGQVPTYYGTSYVGEHNGYYYYKSNEHFNWSGANEKVKSIDTSFDLLSIHSIQEQEFLFSNIPNGMHWIGFTDTTNEGEFVWTDGSPVDFVYWDVNEPNNSTAGNEDWTLFGYGHQGSWNDGTNYSWDKYPFLFKVEKIVPPPPPLPKFTEVKIYPTLVNRSTYYKTKIEVPKEFLLTTMKFYIHGETGQLVDYRELTITEELVEVPLPWVSESMYYLTVVVGSEKYFERIVIVE